MNFSELKVIELAGVLAGPSVGMFFAELGAEVTKVENVKTGGDVTRSWKLASEDENTNVSAYFSSVNYKKKYLLKDLKEEKDYQEVCNLIKSADILLVNFKSGDDKKLKLDYDRVKQLNPSIIYAAITGFGDLSDRAAYDLILQAESGYMSMNGQKNSPPTKMPVALIDVLAGHQLKEALLIEMLKRGDTPRAMKITVSLFDSALSSLVNQASNYLMTGQVPRQMGSEHPNIAPYGEIFETEDGKKITLAIGSDKHFKKLCKLLALENLPKDIRFENNQNRVQNRRVLYQILNQKIVTKTSEIVSELIKLDVPAAIIKNIDEVFISKEAQSLILEEQIEDRKTKRVKSIVYKKYD